MIRTIFFTSDTAFENEFKRCSKEYNHLEMYVAWVGNPHARIPFEYLNNLSKLTAVIGVSFCQTHPDGIQFLMELNADVRVAKEDVLYHPKVYIFTNEKKIAVFIGSSNFTHNGFYENHEANVLIEGSANDKVICDLETEMEKYLTKEFSFVPDEQWLSRYRERYKKRRQKIKDAGLEDEAEKEEDTTNSAAWLAIADWDMYMKYVIKGLKTHSTKYHDSLKNKVEFLNLYKQELTVPWETEYFKDIEKRRMIGGMAQYGWLGHVAASGNFRRMLANGSSKEHRTIANSINAIADLPLPLDWNNLRKHLNNLVALRPSMKVWGRLLAIVRPDLFCTISAPQVRKNIANTLDKSEKYFEEVEGYLALIQLIHSSPWFNSKAPIKKNELEIWKSRVAFLDVVFYN